MKIRLPEALKDRIEAAAQKAGRTLNSEVVARLQKSFEFPLPTQEMSAEDLGQVHLKKELGHRQHMLDIARQRFEASRLRHELLVGQYEFTRRTRDPETSEYARQLHDKVTEAEHELRVAIDQLRECEHAVAHLSAARRAPKSMVDNVGSDRDATRNKVTVPVEPPSLVPIAEVRPLGLIGRARKEPKP